ncbi:GOLPH3/VPS74 family protein [Parafrankia sp. FMc2]|uniref:GOLPH3/VPS74 family protein n=1 Tax=Parafrankia sp. FMc2 TaxID=3233196 RepID=UPI0034D69712
MEPPSSLPGQLFLLAYDLDRDRMRRSPYLGRALRAAALTELRQQGAIADERGRVRLVPASGAGRHPRPGAPGRGAPDLDALSAAVAEEISARPRPRKWRHWVDRNQRAAVRTVRDELAAGHWIRVEHRRILAVIPSTVVTVRDRAMVRRLHGTVDQVLRVGSSAGANPVAASLAALLGAGEIGALRSWRARRAVRHRLAVMEPVAGPAVAALRAAVRSQKSEGA